MKIQQIRNATIKVQYGSLTLLVDPWLQDRGTGFSARTIIPEMVGVKTPLNDLPFSVNEILTDVDYCIVTHVHPDHFTPDYLPKDIKIIVQDSRDEQKLRDFGFSHIIPFTEKVMNLGDITITKVSGVHGDNPKVAEMMGNVSGFILQCSEEKTLYIAGDTIYYDEVSKTLHKYTPDVVILNCCEATNPDGRLIMNLQDISSVLADVPTALVIASHLDTVNHALLSSDDVKNYVRANGLTRVSVPCNGEIIVV